MHQLTLYSPAPPSNHLHRVNVEFGERLQEHTRWSVDVAPIAEPGSLERAAALSADLRPLHLPILVQPNVLPALRGGGPEWHAYAPHPRLRFLATLYETGVGLLCTHPAIRSRADIKGRRIGVVRRPSSVRVMIEALLRDGWGLIDDVTIVDAPGSSTTALLREGAIDATFMNFVVPTADGSGRLLAAAEAYAGSRWLNIDADVIARMNAANSFQADLITLPNCGFEVLDGRDDGHVAQLNFRQALMAWDDTPAEVVQSIMECIAGDAPSAASLARRAFMPGLRAEEMHEGARAFFGAHGVDVERLSA